MNLPSNIKDILNIPTGSRNVAVSSYSSLTDSQLWPENSQSTSQDLCLSSRNAPQSSQEGSDQTILNAYLAKPLLFRDVKDKPRTSWILDKFEEDKKKAKEKTEGELLIKECENIREILNNMQHLVGTEQNAAVCQTVFERFDDFASTLQNNLNRLQNEISQHLDTVVNKVSRHSEMMHQILQKSLEGLKEERGGERRMLEKALEHLNILVSSDSFKPRSERVMDTAIQTSPQLLQSVVNIVQENKNGGSEHAWVSQTLEQERAEVFSQQKSTITRRRKTTRGTKRRRKKWPAVRSNECIASDENGQPSVNQSKHPPTHEDSPTADSLVTLNSETRTRKPLRCCVSQQFWSQESISPRLQDVMPIIDRLSAECNTGTSVTPLGFWQLFETNDSDAAA